MITHRLLPGLAVGLLLWTAAGRCVAEPPVDFNRDVRPILSHHCFACHGPDDKARKAKLRLDSRAEATKPARSGQRPVVPGRSDESELVQRILADEGTGIMPPPSVKKPLSEKQKQILKRWVEGGAEFTEHWAFVPPRQAPLPEVRQAKWPRNALDYFILARLEKEGLRPSPEADHYTLARRVYLDLIGLPPTPAEADAYVNDPAPDAYERLVDRLLNSPHYGERWARRWLDLARYADTNGYEKDRPRSIWPWRDWVIRAINDDMPFDRFTVEQLAGDLLPNATPDQKVATGFHRNTMLNEEGGIDPLEFRFHALTDRVATTGTVWLGLTLGCAQCHTHKFDPVPQREYYQFLAFLNNADEPEIAVPQPEITRRRDELQARITALEADLAGQFPPDEPRGPDDKRPEEQRRRDRLERAFEAWRGREAEGVRWAVLRPTAATANLPRLTVLDDASIFAEGDQTKSDTYNLTFRAADIPVRTLRVEAMPDERLPRGGPGRVYYEGPIGDFTLSEITVTATGKPVPITAAAQSFASGKFTAQAAIDGNPQTGWSINGRQGQRHAAVFTLERPLPPGTEFRVRMVFERHFSAGLGRFRIAATDAAAVKTVRDWPAEELALLQVPVKELTAEQRQTLLARFLAVAPELEKPRKAIDALRKQLPAYPTTLVMQERPADLPRPTFVHHRGEFLQPTDRVEPNVFAFLPPLPTDSPRDRLALARWLVSPENPLVARVTVNRQWQAFFGTGIVSTVQDFGFQGAPPTHPALLDWLAVEFVKRGWSRKQLHRLIVTSATYRQASRVTPELLAADPENRLLARGPHVRLEAEQIRDTVLRESGLLSEKVGGPSVFPPQPPGVTTEGAYGKLDWKVSEGPDRYRRGLYTFTKRTAPYAMFSTFDGPSGEFCTARREVSNTPLQALTLLNDPAILEAAQALGRRMATAGGDVKSRVTELFRRCLTRPPEPEELDLLVRFFESQKARFASKELDAAPVAGAGPGDAAERAAWTTLARALFNLDEAFTKG